MKLKIKPAKFTSTITAINTPTAGIVEARQACSREPQSPQNQFSPERFIILFGTSQLITAETEDRKFIAAGNFLKKQSNEKIKIKIPIAVIKIPL